MLITETNQRLAVAWFRTAVTAQNLIPQFTKVRYKEPSFTVFNPCCVLRDHIIACAVSTDDEGVAPLRSTANVHIVLLRLANVD